MATASSRRRDKEAGGSWHTGMDALCDTTDSPEDGIS